MQRLTTRTVIKLSVFIPSVTKLHVFKLTVIMWSVILINVNAPFAPFNLHRWWERRLYLSMKQVQFLDIEFQPQPAECCPWRRGCWPRHDRQCRWTAGCQVLS